MKFSSNDIKKEKTLSTTHEGEEKLLVGEKIKAWCNYKSCKTLVVNLKLHKLKKHSNKILLCNKCDFSTNYYEKLQKHFEFNHKNGAPKNAVKCLHCSFAVPSDPKTFPNRQIRKHMHNAHFVCKVCQTKYNTRTGVSKHFDQDHRIGDDMSKLKCSVDGCPREFKSSIKDKKYKFNFYGIIQHVKRDHKGIRYECDEIVIRNADTSKCEKKFTKLHSLNCHKKKKHYDPQKPKVNKNSNPTMQCTVCGKQLLRSSLYGHMRNTHSSIGLLSCLKCSFSTRVPNSLKYHKNQHLPGKRCLICSFSTSSSYNFKRHMKYKHERGESFLCSFCDYKSFDPNHLKQHEQTHGEYTYKCDICKYKGKTEVYLKRHGNIHKDPKYTCNQCDYKSFDVSNLKCHKIVRHSDITLKCGKCDYSAKLKRTLKQHVQKKHSNKEP